MLEPKEIVITDMKGVAKTFVISKMPYYPAREVITQFIPTATPKVGDYKANEALSKILMRYVAVVLPEGQQLALETQALVEAHVDFRTGLQIEKEMLEYNAGFFDLEGISSSFEAIATKVQAWIMRTLTDSQAQSSLKAKRPSTNSKRSTRSKTHS